MAPPVTVFFYGSFMNPRVLAQAGVVPTGLERAQLLDFRLRLDPTATLVPAPGEEVWGVVGLVRHSDLSALYTDDWFGYGVYLPQAVLLNVADQPTPALTYIRWDLSEGKPSHDYVQALLEVAEEFEFPDTYIETIISISSFVGHVDRDA